VLVRHEVLVTEILYLQPTAHPAESMVGDTVHTLVNVDDAGQRAWPPCAGASGPSIASPGHVS